MLAECGGKDALLVDADADLDAAADAAAWGAMSNAGQTCVGVERVYVVESAYHAFLDKLGQRVAQLRPGDDESAAYGPMTLPGQVEVVERHLADAVARGGRAAFGGLDSVRAPFVSPVVLVDVPEDSAAVREETFGPVVTVTPVPSLTEAVRLANASPYALGSAVFAKRRGAALRAARALRSGMTSVNSVISFAAVPALPFGGSGESGIRADSRGRRAAGVLPGQVDHQAADEAGGTDHHVQPDGHGHGPDRQAGHGAARPPVRATAPLVTGGSALAGGAGRGPTRADAGRAGPAGRGRR